ncbi:NAD(P)/FAD-dependent oxidoreductase [Rubinisphaera sp.]|uniref:NAD(P)/FAD-dependent oxidoreductase n=1 Tax=Rubinisphaera sp. TaxID=2024857 RepID=UPI0025E263A9|nr:NAD(P)/FAD-dependent oxidoreductase [Rubinisphaera sp.]
MNQSIAHISKTTAATQLWDAVVIGGGPAGATSAFLLAHQGFKVLIVEKKTFPRAKVCGCCLSGRAVRQLEHLGLSDVLSRAIPLKSFVLKSAEKFVQLPTDGGVVLSRSELDYNLLQKAVAAGANLIQGSMAHLGQMSDQSRIIKLQSPEETVSLEAKLVLCCCGLGEIPHDSDEEFPSVIKRNSKIGVAAVVDSGNWIESQTIEMIVDHSGYVGLVQLEDGKLNLAAALNRAMIKQAGGVTQVICGMLERTGFDSRLKLIDPQWQGTLPMTRQMRCPASPRTFLLGDAAGYVEPFTGEGMAWAFESAELVQSLAGQAIHNWQPQLVQDWNFHYQKLVRKRQFTCKFLKRMLDTPWLIQPAIHLLNIAPQISRPFIRSIHG